MELFVCVCVCVQAPSWRTAAALWGLSVPVSAPVWTQWSAAATNTCRLCPEDSPATSPNCESEKHNHSNFLEVDDTFCINSSECVTTRNPFRLLRCDYASI